MHTVLHLALIAVTWTAYFALHSALAANPVKRWIGARFPTFMPLYRLTYNLLALIFLIPPATLTLVYPGDVLWRWHGLAGLVANGLAFAAMAGFVWSLRYYDGMSFLGLRQWGQHLQDVDQGARFTVSPLHRCVRHPWYFFLLVVIWTRDLTAGSLVFALVATAYLVIGSRYEEDKLVALHGDAYREYRRHVPALTPWPGKRLTVDEAEGILKLHNTAAKKIGP